MFLGLPRPTDFVLDGGSRLYAASWKGGQYRYGGEQIGYIARLTYPGAKPSQVPDLKGASDARLVELVTSDNQVHRRYAQHELVRRGPTPDRVAQLEKRVLGAGSLRGTCRPRIFTLKQLAGAGSHAVLIKAAADASVREFALRALADRREELANVPKALFLQALGDANPRVQLQAITGLKRLGAVDAAGALLPLTASTDPVVPHVAIDALVSLGASEAALGVLTSATASPAVTTGALRVLQQLHTLAHRQWPHRDARRDAEYADCAPASCGRSRVSITATACGGARWRSGGAPGPTRRARTTIRSPGKRARGSCRFCARRS